MKNLLKNITLRLNLINEKNSLIGLDIWEQNQAKKTRKQSWQKNECSGIKGTFIDKEGNITFKI